MGELAAIVTPTRALRVTFFEDRAEVVRGLTVRLPAGRSRVEAHGVTLLVDDRSIACASSTLRVVQTRVRRRAEDPTSAEEIAALEHARERARTEVARIDRALQRAAADVQRAEGMLGHWLADATAIPSRAAEAAEELGRAYEAIDRAALVALDAQAARKAERDVAQGEAVRADMALAEARAKKPRYEAFVEIEVLADAEGEHTLELTYRTPCALWRPEHLARLVRSGADAAITITTYATVWQLTGEEWKDVRCRFSTARPARSAEPPLLEEDALASRKKTELERRQVVVEARDQAVNLAGADHGTRDVDEMPGVDDGGEARWLDAGEATTIESDGRPVRVEIATRTVPCTVERVCFPEKSPAAHVRARGTLTGGPLLAGPLVLGRETELVGRSKTPFLGAGEPFEIGFGLDDGLRVQRKLVEKRKTTPVTGTQHVAREVKLWISNLSDERRSLVVVERVPVSEIEDVTVIVGELARGKRDAKNGFVTFTEELGPRGTRELALEYRIEADANVVLP